MIDVADIGPQDLIVPETQANKAGNILSVQIGSLEYAPNFGIDLRYFLQHSLKFENISFKSYLVQILAQNGINVAELITTENSLFETYDFGLAADDQSTGLVAR